VTTAVPQEGLLGDIEKMVELAQEAQKAKQQRREREQRAEQRSDAIEKFWSEELEAEWRAEMAADADPRIMEICREHVRHARDKGVDAFTVASITSYIGALPPAKRPAAYYALSNVARERVGDPSHHWLVRAQLRRARDTIRAKAPKPSKKEIPNG
jgi:hypothetical protein